MNRTAKVPASDIETIAADWVTRRDAGVSAAEERAFERWRAADPRHAAAIAHHEQTWRALERPLRAGQMDSMLQQLRARATRRSRHRLAATAAALAVALFAGKMWRSHQPAAAPPIVATATPPNALVVGPDKRLLPDGSTMELRNGSDFAVDFSGALRRVMLSKGEAHFDVVPNPDRAFVVAARGVEVRALGTAFSVQIGASEVEVLVTHGRVAVETAVAPSPAGNAPAPLPVRLATVEAGKRVVVDVAAGTPDTAATEEISAAELDERLSWRAPRLDFSDTPLAEAITLMNRHSGRKPGTRFVIADPALNDIRLSGLFRADNTDTFVRILEASFGVKAEHAGGTIALRKAR